MQYSASSVRTRKPPPPPLRRQFDNSTSRASPSTEVHGGADEHIDWINLSERDKEALFNELDEFFASHYQGRLPTRVAQEDELVASPLAAPKSLEDAIEGLELDSSPPFPPMRRVPPSPPSSQPRLTQIAPRPPRPPRPPRQPIAKLAPTAASVLMARSPSLPPPAAPPRPVPRPPVYGRSQSTVETPTLSASPRKVPPLFTRLPKPSYLQSNPPVDMSSRPAPPAPVNRPSSSRY